MPSGMIARRLVQRKPKPFRRFPVGKAVGKGRSVTFRQAEFVILKSLRFCWVNTKPSLNFHHTVRNLPPFWDANDSHIDSGIWRKENFQHFDKSKCWFRRQIPPCGKSYAGSWDPGRGWGSWEFCQNFQPFFLAGHWMVCFGGIWSVWST